MEARDAVALALGWSLFELSLHSSQESAHYFSVSQIVN